MSLFVVDASVAIKWVVDEVDSSAAISLADHDLIAPDLLLIECANALWAKARRGELAPLEVEERTAALASSPIELVSQADLLADALRLALHLEHPVYDCLYLALAKRRGISVVTADRHFWRATQKQSGHVHSVVLLTRFSGSQE